MNDQALTIEGFDRRSHFHEGSKTLGRCAIAPRFVYDAGQFPEIKAAKIDFCPGADGAVKAGLVGDFKIGGQVFLNFKVFVTEYEPGGLGEVIGVKKAIVLDGNIGVVGLVVDSVESIAVDMGVVG